MQTDIDMVTKMAMEIGVKSVYIRTFRPQEISQSTRLSSIQSNTNDRMIVPLMDGAEP
jgi:hypothetical protein